MGEKKRIHYPYIYIGTKLCAFARKNSPLDELARTIVSSPNFALLRAQQRIPMPRTPAQRSSAPAKAPTRSKPHVTVSNQIVARNFNAHPVVNKRTCPKFFLQSPVDSQQTAVILYMINNSMDYRCLIRSDVNALAKTFRPRSDSAMQVEHGSLIVPS